MLRAEVMYGSTRIVGHTIIVQPDRAFIRTDALVELGASVDVELSFRGALEPARFRGVVIEHHTASGPGEPAGVWVSLAPCTERDATELQGVLDSTSHHREVRVLLVEDSSMTRDVFAHVAAIAHSATHVVLHAVATAEAAWKHLQRVRYHLALIDHFLPETTGAELVARIRADEQLATLPIIGLSMGGNVARDAMLAAGADLFLDKPVQPRELLTTLGRFARLGEESSP